MTRWVRWAIYNQAHRVPVHSAWHATNHVGETICGLSFVSDPSLIFADFEPVEDECRLCRRALDRSGQ